MTHPTPAEFTNFCIPGNQNGADAVQSMPILASDISSGVQAMDRLHHDLFSAMDMLSSSDDSTFCNQYAAFVGKVEQAFREEEAWMDDIEFPAVTMHQEQHARVLGALHNVHARVMAGEFGLGRQVVGELLPQWLLLHISSMDIPLAQTMQQAQRESDPALLPS